MAITIIVIIMRGKPVGPTRSPSESKCLSVPVEPALSSVGGSSAESSARSARNCPFSEDSRTPKRIRGKQWGDIMFEAPADVYDIEVNLLSVAAVSQKRPCEALCGPARP